jgi:hypothetical protein
MKYCVLLLYTVRVEYEYTYFEFRTIGRTRRSS